VLSCHDMAYCRRVPAFPLADGAALLSETAARLGTEEPLSPEALDGLFSTMATLRRHIHNNPEPGFEEVKTQAFIKTTLQDLAGIDSGAMRACAKTGLVVDIKGQGPPSGNGAETVKCVALRADMDALRMTELNTSLPYRSANEGVAQYGRARSIL
jgi:metal-dependent amidase/aminoacylase/carboxypeptidase family protein